VLGAILEFSVSDCGYTDGSRETAGATAKGATLVTPNNERFTLWELITLGAVVVLSFVGAAYVLVG
jgi:hypothetical protein